MIVEVRGANTHNKGAELMLRSIVAELGDEVELAVDHGSGSYEERARLGLLQKVSYRRADPALDLAGRAVPARVRRHLRERYGLVLERDAEAVLDASGFAYSDQFDQRRSDVAAARFARAKRRGAAVVLLPQALGPFSDADRRAAFLRIVEHSDVVYARERVSLDHALAAGAPAERLRLAPDFTCLLDGEQPPGFDPPERLALVVPSAKLLSETEEAVRAAYLPFLAGAVARLSEGGFAVRLLVHERGDAETVERLQGLLDEPAPVIREESAVRVKGVVAAAAVVVGSRFHALVSALSQGVPALGVGWSHKYEMLFDDYGCAENVVDPRLDQAALRERLERLANDAELCEELRRRAASERARAAAMWDEVRTVLRLPASSAVRRANERSVHGLPAS